MSHVILNFFIFLLALSPCWGDWAEERLSEMSLAQKVGQLFIAPGCPKRGQDHLDDLFVLIKQYHLGGMILKQADPHQQVAFIHRMQGWAEVPLLCVQDGEWGLSMRLSDTIRFPKNLTLGAIDDLDLIEKTGREIGRQCRAVGVHVNLAPVVDVNTNPQNPIIHMRSFGDDPVRVASHALAWIRGLQSERVMACAKHFPGHGDTQVDSHRDLPHVERPELFPFVQLIQSGVSLVMTAHLAVPALTGDPNLPITFSKAAVTDLLQEKMGFQGLIITDALNMRALTNYYRADDIALQAYLAGHDLLLYGDHIAPNVDQIVRLDIPRAIEKLKASFESGELSIEELNRRVLKILKAKQKYTRESSLVPDELHLPEAYALKRELYRRAVTLLKDDEQILPLKKCVCRDPRLRAALQNHLEIVDVDAPVIFPVYPTHPKEKNCGVSDEELASLKKFNEMGIPVVLVIFGTPYSLPFLPKQKVMILAYEDDPDAFEAVVDLLRQSQNSIAR